MARHFVFLQGLSGPSFRLLAKQLRAHGHRASRINLNGGDQFDWRIGDAVSYRGTADAWPNWLRHYLIENGATDIVLFGELRPRHRAAMMIAAELHLQLFEFEEGYLRPNHVTVQRWIDGARCLAQRNLSDEHPEILVEGFFRRRMREAILYWVAATLMKPWFRHYRSHRLYPAWLEMLYWIRRWTRKSAEKKRSKSAIREVGSKPFFLFPLQLDGDAQIVGRSSFASMANALDTVLKSFANHAPQDTFLLVKRHPFDPDIADWARIVDEQSGQWRVADRVRFLSRFDLDPLLEQCVGVVTVNSTVGPLALARGKPVHVMGQAIYDSPGLTHTGAIDDFWTTPQSPEPGAFELFTARLKANSQVNGGFHSESGLLLLTNSALSVLLPDRSA